MKNRDLGAPLGVSDKICLGIFSLALKKGDLDRVAWNRKGPPLLCPRRGSNEETGSKDIPPLLDFYENEVNST